MSLTELIHNVAAVDDNSIKFAVDRPA